MQPSKHNGRISCAESNTLYVRNVPASASVEEIRSLLSMYGTLVSSATRRDNLGAPVWVVYAEYDCVSCAKNSLARLHGNTSFFGVTPPILAKFADSTEIKEDRRRRRGEATGAASPSPSSATPSSQPSLAPVSDGDSQHAPISVSEGAVKRSVPPPRPWIPILGHDEQRRSTASSGHIPQRCSGGATRNAVYQPSPPLFANYLDPLSLVPALTPLQVMAASQGCVPMPGTAGLPLWAPEMFLQNFMNPFQQAPSMSPWQ